MPSTADFVMSRLTEWGIDRIFGYPGDGINGFIGALDRADGSPELIQPRHEEMGAFMAGGQAKFTGGPGCCLATSGGGAVHLLNGLYDAKLDHQPVVALVGQQKRMSLGSGYQQEIDPALLFADVSEFVGTCMDPAQARHLVDRACRTALARRTVTTLVFPADVQETDAVPSPPRSHGAVFSSVGWSRPRVLPAPDDLAHAAEVLNAGERVAILAGQGAAGAAEELTEVADALGAGVAKTLLGRDVLPDDEPWVTGPIGLLGSTATHEMMSDCDTLLMVGTSFPYAEWLPKEGQARAVQIDLDGSSVGMRYPLESHLVGDARGTLRELRPLLRRHTDRSWREQLGSAVQRWRRVLDDRAAEPAEPVNPQRVVHELSARLPDRAIVTADSGSATNWWAQYLRLREGMRATLGGTLASMGAATPYAISAKLVHPDRPVVALVGDGAFQMNGMAELITVRRHLDRLTEQNPALVFCVFNNRDLNQVTWEQRAQAGDPRFPGSQSIPDVPYAEFARLLGLSGIRVEDPDALGDAWDAALAADGPCVLDVVVDPEIPPMPPHVGAELAGPAAKAMLKGDPEEAGVLVKGARQKAHEFTEAMRDRLPGRRRDE